MEKLTNSLKNILKLGFVVALTLSSFSSFAGGGWTHAKGEGYFKLSQWWVIADQHYSSNGRIDPNQTTGVLNTSLYGEYGITDKLEAQLFFPFISYAFNNDQVSATTGEVFIEGQSLTSVGDTDIGLKYGIIQNKPIVLSAYVWFGLPLGKEGSGDRSGLQTGDGEFNQTIGLIASTSKRFGNVTGFASLGFDINNREEDFSDEWRINAEVGADFYNKFIFILKLTNLSSFRNGLTGAEAAQLGGSSGLFSNNREFLALTVEAAYNITDKVGVTANVAPALSGELVLARPSFSAGVYFNLK